MKKDPETFAPSQNLPQNGGPLTPAPNGEDPLKFDDWPLNLSRGPSFNNGADLGLSRFNSFNMARAPGSLEPNFAQCRPRYLITCLQFIRASLRSKS